MLEMSHNVYQNVLFGMQFALSKSNVVEQKSLLLESLDYIKKSTEDEDNLKKIILEKAATIEIANHLLNLEEKDKMCFKTHRLISWIRLDFLRKQLDLQSQ